METEVIELSSSIFLLMKQIDDGLRMHMNCGLKTWDLTYSQLGVLKFLYLNNGQATQKELEKLMGVSHPTVTGLVTRLEKNGFVRTRTGLRDKRNKVVVLTEKAMKYQNSVMKERDRHDRILLDGLSEEDQEILRNYLERILQNMNREQQDDL